MENDEDIDEVHLCAPYNYIRKMPGKGIRNQMTKAFNLWLNIDEQIMNNILSIIELLHNASLMLVNIFCISCSHSGIFSIIMVNYCHTN